MTLNITDNLLANGLGLVAGRGTFGHDLTGLVIAQDLDGTYVVESQINGMTQFDVHHGRLRVQSLTLFSTLDPPGIPGENHIYAAKDGHLYFRNSAGAVTDLTTAGSGISTLNGITADIQSFAKVDDTNVTLAISSVGSTHTFTLGWTGQLSVTRGGTGLSTFTGGDMLYYATGTALSKLAIDVSGRWLGSSGTAPQWNAPAALTKADDTNVTLTLGGSPTTALLNATSLTLGWTGTLAVARGGSGAGTLTGLLQGNGTSAFTTITNSSTIGQVLRVTGASTYAWGALNLANGDAITGDLPYANLTPSSAASILLGRGSAAGAGDWQEITVGTGLAMSGTALTSTITQYTNEQAQDAVGAMVDASLVYVDATPLLTRAALTGDVTASQGSNSTTIANDAVTLVKMANVATGTVFYRKTAGTGDPEIQTLATLKTDLGLTGTNTGDITLANVGSSPNAQGASLSGQQLTLQPASASFPGVITTGTQTIAGAKTFSGDITTSNLFPGLTDTYDFGSYTKLWRQGFVSQMNALLFAENTISVIGGWFYVAKDQGTLPAVTSGATTIDFGKAMTPNDFILIRAHDTGGTIKAEYIQIGTLVSGTNYNVTRDVAAAHGTDPAWADGTPFVVLGNTGNGRIELNASDTPRISMVVQGSTYNAQTELLRAGDLNGNWGYVSATYGFAVGEYASGKASIAVEQSAGIRIFSGTSVTGQWTLAGEIILGASGSENMFINGSSIRIRDGATVYTDLTAGVLVLGVSTTENIRISGTAVELRDGPTVYTSVSAGVVSVGNIDNEHVLINASGVALKDGANIYGAFAATTTLGLTTAEHINITATSIQFKDIGTVWTDLTAGQLVLGVSTSENVLINSTSVQLRDSSTAWAELTGGSLVLGRVANSNTRIVVDSTNGYRIIQRDGSAVDHTLGQWNTAGVLTIGEVGASKSNVQITGGELKLRNNTTDIITLSSAGAVNIGSLAGDVSGVINISNTSTSDGSAAIRATHNANPTSPEVFFAIVGGTIATSGTGTTTGLLGYGTGATTNYGGYFGNGTVGSGNVLLEDNLYIGANRATAIQKSTYVGSDLGTYNSIKLLNALEISAAQGGLLSINISDTTFGTGITIGGDVNLYRSAANILKTDDSFFITGTVRIGDAAAKHMDLGDIGDSFRLQGRSGDVTIWSSDTERMRIKSGGTIHFPGLATTASAANAFLNSSSSPANQLLRSTSSLRYKKDVLDISPDETRAVLALRPVKFRSLASADDPDQWFIGLIAEEVAVIDPRLATYYEGKPDGVQYDRLSVYLLSVVKKQQEQINRLMANPS